MIRSICDWIAYSYGVEIMKFKDNEMVTIDSIIEAIRKYQPDGPLELVRRAYNLANDAHKGQTRVSGEEYIMHPVGVAKILSELQIDALTISAALLHDVVEDTTYTLAQMREIFGDEVAMLIDGVTKLGKMEYKSKEERKLENYRKMFLAMARDIRVILIKLADRLHNMRTLKYMREDKQKRIASETIEIYAPLANRLGISNVKWEMEDLCLRYLEPEIYYDLVAKVKQKREERQEFIDDAIRVLSDRLAVVDIQCEIKGRAKHFYSIYKKMKKGNKDISEIYDLSAIRILVDSVKDCYGVLGTVHTLWKPLPGRFKDYIAMPKQNMYQSLHTTVIGSKGYPLEIQIRTFQMHQVAEYGIAAHWKYKEAGGSAVAGKSYDQKMTWLRQLVDLQKELNDPKEYVEALKVDVFSDEVFVFTPKGDVVNLPAGSNPIDFAYNIHTDIGHHCIGAKVNGKIVPLEYKLTNGDIVSVITNKQNNGPSLDWLNIVASSTTRNKIRQWFKKAKREENIVRGMELIERESKRLGYDPKVLLKDNRLMEVAKRLNIFNEEDVLAALGYGGLTVNGIITKLIELYKKEIKEETPPDLSQMLEELKTKNVKHRSGHGVLVEGEGGLLVRLARCCNPIPGDEIVGFVTRGRGVSVHRSDCQNVLGSQDELSRMIQVSWDIESDKMYTVMIDIVCSDRAGVLNSLITATSESKINISAINARTHKNRTATISMGLNVKNSEQIEKIMMRFRRMKDVYSVSRSMASGAAKEGK